MKQKPKLNILATMKFYLRKIIELLPQRIKLDTVKMLEKLVSVIKNDDTYSLAIKQLINHSISNSNTGDYKEAERCLQQAAVLDPFDSRIAPHLGRVRFLQSRSIDVSAQSQTKRMLMVINSMKEEIETDPIYVPGEFWDNIGKFHLQLLERYGIENFKRTVSHHYQNWFMCTKEDDQVRQLFKTWPAHFASEPWFNIMEIPDNIGLPIGWSFETPIYPLASANNREIYRVAVGLLWEYVNDNDTFNVLNDLTESEIGNPVRIWRKGSLISSDLAHSVRERNMLLEAFSLNGNEGLIIGELGAGHGRLADIFGRTTNFRHFIFDITPALFVSQWYTKSLFPNEKIFEFRHFDDFAEIRDELQECRFAFFTSNQIEKLPSDYFDLFINLNSLAEMRLDQIRNFLHHIDRVTSKGFLSRQQQQSINPVEQVPLSKAHFSMPERWSLVLDKEDDIYPLFFNQIWKRQPS